jgi:hypothetical protein
MMVNDVTTCHLLSILEFERPPTIHFSEVELRHLTRAARMSSRMNIGMNAAEYMSYF